MPTNGKQRNGTHRSNGNNGNNGKNGSNGKHSINGKERRIRELKARPIRPGDPQLPAKGRLLIIGGHEAKVGNMVILRALARLVGSGKLVVATLASEQPAEQWERYESVLRSLGIRHLNHLRVESRADAETPRAMGILEGATGVFFTGGRWNDVNGMRLPSNVAGYLVEYEAVTPEPSSAALSLALGALALLRRTRGTRRR